jgi:hypothetical protein
MGYLGQGVERTDNPDGFTLEDRLGSHTIRFVSPGVAEMVLRGGLHESAVPLIAVELDREIARAGSLRFFVDSIGTASYTSEFRRKWTAWLSDNRARLEVHVLFSSRLVAMGLTLANAVMGGSIRTYSSRGDYEALIGRASAVSSASGG